MKFESFHQNNTPTNQEREEKQKTNEKLHARRNRIIAAAIAAAGIVEKPHEVHAAEVDPAMTWEQGVEALRHDVYAASTETAVMYAA